MVAAAAVGALVWSVRRRRPGIAVYVGLALFACLAGYLYGATPWVIGKAMAFSSPALLTAALAGGGLLFMWRRVAGTLVLVALAGGGLWCNALAYHDVTLAPAAEALDGVDRDGHGGVGGEGLGHGAAHGQLAAGVVVDHGTGAVHDGAGGLVAG